MSTPGYHGCYLRVDLARGTAQRISLSDEALRKYVGGIGLGVFLLRREGAASIDPLAAAAPVAFVLSPLVGSPLTTSAKFAVVSKSPLTDRINDSLASSGFAVAAKRCGFDALVLVGRSAEPSILVIDEGRVDFEGAAELWGTTTDQAESRLRDRLGPDYRIAAIGPAGERRVRYATISHDGRHAGRGGSGAVLGSKNIKAIAVRGTQPCRWADPDRLLAVAKRLSDASMGPATAKYRELGTASNLLLMNRLSALPTRNFQQGRFAGADRLAPEQLGQTRRRTRAHCASCTIGCEHLYELHRDGGPRTQVRLEYENLFALGPLCGIDDPDAVLTASKRCDELGIDTISAGGTIAFAMECAGRGLIDAEWLEFGSASSLLAAVERIGRREGLGDLMAEGSRRLAHHVGGDSIAFAPQVKGLEIPGYEPRAMQTMALGFAVGARGADHNRSGAYEVDFSETADRRRATPETARRAVETEDRAALIDSLILCKFLRHAMDDLYAEAAEMLQAVTGWDVTSDELRTVAQRVVAARKQFNIEAGWTPNEDTLPDRILNQPLPDDPSAALSRDRLQRLVEAYHVERSWSPEGWIGREELDRLGIA